MTLDRSRAKKLASLSAVGMGALATADDAQAAAIVINAGNTQVGFASGANPSFSHVFPGVSSPRFLFDRFSTFFGTTYSRGVDAHGYGGLRFLATPLNNWLKVVPSGSLGTVGSGTTSNNPQIAWWHSHSSSSTSHTDGLAPFSNGYALFRFILSGNFHYGWVELSLINDLLDQGPTLTIHKFAWEDKPNTLLAAGDEMGAPSGVPEPSAFVMTGLGALGLGAAGIRRWRAAQKHQQQFTA